LTTSDIRAMSLQEIDHIFSKLNEFREKFPPMEIGLDLIRQALFSVFGIKYQKGQVDDSIDKALPSFKMTTSEKEDWIKAGYPDLRKWLPEHRKK